MRKCVRECESKMLTTNSSVIDAKEGEKVASLHQLG